MTLYYYTQKNIVVSITTVGKRQER